MDNNKSFDPIRRLTQVLLVSGAINIVLLSLIFYFLIKETPPRPYFEQKPADQDEQQEPLASNQSNGEMIRSFRAIPTQQLLMKLTNSQLVENGYTQRDLALAALVAFHHFDLSRALLGQAQPSQQRKIPLGRNRRGEWVEATVYPGLSEQQFQAIIQFANTERWPLTSQGIFHHLRQKKKQHDPTLVDAFFLTPEFISVETLFNRSEVHVEKSDLLKVLCQGNWALLSTFTEQQRVAQDLSAAKRQKFLLDYIAHGSKAAAYLILKTDGPFAALKLDDKHVLGILNALDEKTPEAEQFSFAMLTSPRSDAVWQMAAARLYDYAGEARPETNLHHAALTRFVPSASMPQVSTVPAAVTVVKAELIATKPSKKTPQKVMPAKPSNPTKATPPKTSTPKKSVPKSEKGNPKPAAKKGKTYIVQDGDSLWKIAKRFKVDIEVLKAHNNLKSDFLKPGSSLKIP